MYESQLEQLRCPRCRGMLTIDDISQRDGTRITDGQLRCLGCANRFPILRSVPRFVDLENYASSFGLQWNVHRETQLDSRSGVEVSNRRFFGETSWPTSLEGERILEVGSGAGRFTECAVSTGAEIFSLDYSIAVDANYSNNGGSDRLLIVQADAYQIPAETASFDKIFCLGVLQHCPDPHAAFQAMLPYLKPGGEIVIDVYRKNWLGKYLWFTPALATKYYMRPFTKRISPERLYRLCSAYIDMMWPVARWIHRLGRYGRNVNWVLLVPDLIDVGLDDVTARQWAKLDCFDMLAPRYDSPQRIEKVRQWLREEQLSDIEVRCGINGVLAKGRRGDVGSAVAAKHLVGG